MDPEGKIYYYSLLRGATRIVTNCKEIAAFTDSKNKALWELAMKELEQSGNIEASDDKRMIFKVIPKKQ